MIGVFKVIRLSQLKLKIKFELKVFIFYIGH